MEIKLMPTYKVQSTTNYDMFKTLDENRDVDHISRIIASIKKVGYVPVPIQTNEFHEVIDGQNRLGACRELELPVYYMVIPGLRIEHCRSLNIGMKNWSNRDFIKSYAVENNNYKYFQSLMQQFPDFQEQVIAFACAGIGFTGGGYTKTVREGRLICDEKQYLGAIKKLSWLQDLQPYVNKVDGKKTTLHSALLFCYSLDSVNSKRMASQFKKYYAKDGMLDGIVNMEKTIESLEKIYNYNNRKNEYVDILPEYKRKKRGMNDESEG